MDNTGTDDRLLYMLGGAMAIGGALMEFVGNALHPRSTDYYGDPAAWLDNATQRSVWFPSHVLILLGSILLIGGFVGLSRSLSGRPGHGVGQLALANALIGLSRSLLGRAGHGVGQLALANALIGLTLIIVTAAIDGLAVAKLDEVWNAGSAPSPDARLVASILYHTVFSLLYAFEITLFGLAPIFYGVAILLGGTYAAWLGWAGILIGASVVLSAVLAMFGVATEFLDAYVWTVVASLFVLWVLLMGVSLWRKAQRLPGRRT